MSLNQPASTATQPPLAVVGLSALFPKAENLDQFWSNIRRGVDAITEVPDTHWNPDDYFDANQKTPDMTYARRGGFLSPVPFDPLEYGITPNNLEAIDTSQLLGLVGAKRALEHAGYGAGRQFDRSRIGCILGVTGTLEMVIPLGARLGHPRWRKALKDAGVPDDVAEDVVQRISESYVPWQENSFPGLLGNVVAGRIANRLDLHGTNCVVDAACASSLSAIHLAALELWTGRSDMVVTGGIDTFNDIFMFMCFSKTPALSPTGDSKPFSETADGTILGEGVGMLVLKRLADAERDGDKIYAVLKGIGTSSDGAGNAVYAPKAEGQVRCLQDAYRVAGVSPSTVELVEAHGTGTKVGDATEVTGLMQVYKASGRRGPWCATGSIKSQIGHTKAAAGAAGVIKAILALQHKVLPPTIKVNQPPAPLLADDSPFYVNTEARPWVKPTGYPRRAAVSAFGFGGSNFHCVLEESPQNIDAIDWNGDIQIVALSATNQAQLSSQLQAWSQPAEWSAIRTRATASRVSFQASHAHRLLFIVERDKTDIAKLVSGAMTMLDKYADRAGWSTPDGAYYGRGAAAGRLGVLFPGQGSQYLGMLRELACRFPVMNDVLSEANDVFASRVENGPARALNRLTDFVYPPPSWTPADRDRCDNELRATQVAQPAIGAVSLGALAILEQFGVQPEAAAGHSYGELTALCASRRFAPKTLYRLSMLRGRLMAEAQEVDGGMLAVGAPLTQVEAAIKEMAIDLVVANYNSPNQIVLSGRIPEIDRATALFSQRNLRGKKLQVAAAFHSPLVATASRAFRPELEVVDFAPSKMPVYANSTGSEYPADPTAARDLLASQLARPVNFVSEIEQMYADGVRTFLEVGPGGVLTGLVNSILSGREFRAVALDSSNGRRGGVFDLAHALAQLSASGHAVRLDTWDPQSQSTNESAQSNRLRIPICGANYVKPRNPLPPRAPMVVPATTPIANVPAANGQLEAVSLPSAQQPLAHAPVIVPASILAAPPAMNPTNMPEPQPPSLNPAAIHTIQLHLQTLKQMQEETARLHQQFLESQESALRTFEELSRRQLELTNGAAFPSSAASIRPAAMPSPAWGAQPPAPAPVAPAPLPPAAPTINSQPPVPSTQYSVLSAPIATATTTTPAPAPLAPAVAASVVPSPALAPAPVPVSIPAPAPAAPVEPPRINSELATTVLAVVSEKTGYPTEMLSLGMSLDHDLGIDSIKRVEILSALQERVTNLPAFKPDELGSLHTLGDVVTLAEARSAGSSAPANAPAITPLPSSQAAPAAVSASLIAATANNSPVPVQCTQYSVLSTATSAPAPSLSVTVLAVVSEKTGYPTEMLNLGMSLDHDLGIDSIKRVEILSALQERVTNLPAFKPDELGSLHTLGDVVTLAEARSTGSGLSAAPIAPVIAPVAAPNALLSAASSAPVNSAQPTTPSAQYSVPSTATSASASLATAGPSLSATVLEVVSEKTGYPTEMLNLGMSLDHDLGIDSIKRVEILSALQERVTALPAFKPDELGSLHTLGDVVTLAEARTAGTSAPVTLIVPVMAPAAVSPVSNSTINGSQPTVQSTQYSVLSTASSTLAPAAPAGPSLSATVLEVVSEKTGYPTEMLNLGMSLDHDLGIDSIKRVEILSALQERVTNLPAFKPEELGSLHTLGDVVTLAEARSNLSGNASPVSLPSASAVLAPVTVNAQPPVPTTQSSVLSTATSAPVATAPAGPSLSATVLEVVSEKTGYPTEMLSLGMSLDHDLGIDSIKRVEILSALQERVTNLPAFKPEELGSLHTLGDVVTLAEARSNLGRNAGSSTAPSASEAIVVAPAPVQRTTVEVNLSQPASLVRSVVRSAPLTPQPALSIAAGSEVWITEDGQGLSLQIATELSRRGLKARLIQLDEPAAITLPERLASLIVVAPSDGTNDRHLWRAIELLQKAGPSLRQSAAGGASVFATLSRLDGRFGFEAQQPLADQLSGGLAGLTKSAAREWPEVACKAIDISGGWASLNEAAVQVVDQLLRKGPVEVGLSPQGATTPTVVEESLSSFRSSAPIVQADDLVIVSGGARGVTAEAAIVAAQKWNCRLAILGRSPAPPAEPEWLQATTTEAEIKQALIRNLPRGTLPKAIEGQLRQILAGREITATLQRLQAANVAAQYYAVDIRDLTAVRDLIVQLQAQFGPVRGIIHGAGVLADQRIEDKTRDQFDRVYQTKVTGLRNLLGAIRPDQLKALCLFSSYTARYGRIGQCDYAIANEVLNKLARQFSIEQRQCHVVSFNWGPWDGGMVTGSLKKLFAAEQVGLIPLADGADLVLQEFSQTSSLPVEVLVLGKSDAQVPEPAPVAQQPAPTPAAPESSELKVAYEKTVDVLQFPFLESHVIGGKAVVPVAIILEWLAHGAIHHNPGLELEGFDDFRVFHGLRMDRNDKPLLRVIVGKPTRVEGRFTVRTQLVSVGARETIHAAGNVILTARPTATPAPQLKIQPQAYSLDMTTAYATKLFHGQHLHGIAAVETCSPDGIVVASRTSPAPWAWMHDPFRNAWLADPLSIDCALQAVILWTQEQRGMPCLPCAIGSYRQFRKAFPTAGVRIAIKVTHATEHTVRADVEFLDGQGQLVAQMTGCESVADASLANAFRQNRLP